MTCLLHENFCLKFFHAGSKCSLHSPQSDAIQRYPAANCAEQQKILDEAPRESNGMQPGKRSSSSYSRVLTAVPELTIANFLSKKMAKKIIRK